ncbi:MAG TPA: hypothetical protein RMH99_23860 [Sandaracinaceae bacterium LLY-WYZ-13_1]|nr:hypothetical protein [Sandaracinaceae bacterium LLY-WYZ-13_1]
MRTTALASLALTLLLGAHASAQELSTSERASALSRVRSLSACLERHHEQLDRILDLIGEAEQQRDRARDARVRRDAEAALEALIARAAEVQRQARACVGGEDLPSPGTRVVERGPAPDPAADAVARPGGTVRTVEEDARLTSNVHVVRGEQVDGQGRLDASEVRRAVRRIGGRLDRCYERYLERGSISARQLDLVFTLRRSRRARSVSVERSGFHDRAFERCVRAAGRRIRASEAPSGGEAVYSYRLRFGREAS